MKESNSSFLSWTTSEAASAADATAAAASKPRAKFRAERIVASCGWYGGSAIELSQRQGDEQVGVWPGVSRDGYKTSYETDKSSV